MCASVLKGIGLVHPKTEMYLYAVPNLYDFIANVKRKRRYLQDVGNQRILENWLPLY